MHPNVAASLFSFILIWAACLNGVSADVSVTVNPSTGVDSSSCNLTSPCRTIAHAIQSRNANAVFLSAGTFVESSVAINSSSPFVNITGLRSSTVFSCRLGASSGPAFTITNTSIAISGITFQNCANFNFLSGVGGAVSASGSNVTVIDCNFFNNMAQTGGAIGVASGSLAVTSCFFQNNTATCPNAASTVTACSAWGGAIGTVETASVSLLGNTFGNNAVNLVLNNVISATSQAVGGGGCISVLYNLSISGSRVTIDGNAFQSCLVQMSGFNNLSLSSQGPVLNWGIQFGNTYGGAVSFYYGLSAVLWLDVHDITSAFTNNECHGSGIISRVGVAGNAYGGCLSIYAGPWSVNTQGSSSIGDVSVLGMLTIIRGNNLVNCSAAMNSQSVTYSGNVYGGGMSLVVGAYSYSQGSNASSTSNVSGSTTVGNSSYTITGNKLTSCIASSVTSGLLGSNGANVYGGGMLLVVGAYSYSNASSASSISSIVSGSTTVGSTSYTITSNSMISCNASLVSSGFFGSNGANAYGGGISVAVGAYSYSHGSSTSSRSIISGSTTVGSTSFTITSNTMTSCNASSDTPGNVGSNGANVYGGGMLLFVGAYSYSYATSASSSSSVSGSTTVGNTNYAITNNTLTSCIASSVTSGRGGSNGANAYGGCISLVVGAYSYSHGSSASSISIVSGSTTVGSTSYTITSNSLTSCNASSVTSGFLGADGANAYGGGVLMVVGASSYSHASSTSSSSSVSGSATVGNASYTITGNTLTSCIASSVTPGSDGSNGANVYGGGSSLVFGAYSYSYGHNANAISSVSGSTTVSNSIYTIASNTLTSCIALSVTSGKSGSNGANAYGGGSSLVVGAYSYSYDSSGAFSSSSVSGSTTVGNTSFTIKGNTLISCIASSVTPGSAGSNGANVYGGGNSLVVGAYSYSFESSDSISNSSVSGSTAVGNTSYTITSNTFVSCNASSVTPGSVGSFGSNAYGGGMLLVVGAYSYSFGNSASSSSSVSGSTTVGNTNYAITNNTLTSCIASSVSSETTSSIGANVYGGGMSLVVGAYCFAFSFYGGDISSSVSGSTAMSDSSYAITKNTFCFCQSLSQNGATSNSASSFGGAISVLHESASYPLNVSSFSQAIGVSSSMRVFNCAFSNCNSVSSSASCASGASNAAGGAMFCLVSSVDVDMVSNMFSNASAVANCAASLSSTYSIGGGLSIMKAGDIRVSSTNFTGCFAQGVLQATNVFVSGGGLQVQASRSLILDNCLIRDCSVRSAFSAFLQSGGGALGTQNVSSVRIFGSNFRGNTDASSTGSIFVQQLQDGSAMNVSIDQSIVCVSPSSTPALNISCGSNCSQQQQKRILIMFTNTSVVASSQTAFVSSAIMSIPRWSLVVAQHSNLSCNGTGTSILAVLADTTDQTALFSCAPCSKPFEVALTSTALDMGKMSSELGQLRLQCRDLLLPSGTSQSAQQCPFGVSYCSTIINITVGFWANFTDGNLSKASRCPSNYCGCRNIQFFADSTCQLFPPLAPEFQPNVSTNDALCNGNRSGVLCGGCKPGFTQSLDGYSCIDNDVCMQNVGWTWAVTIVGYVAFSIYIVVSSLRADAGLVKCVLFYGQMSVFASATQLSTSGAGTQASAVSAWFARVTQFDSITSLYSQTCYGINLGAYDVTAAQLAGPAIVLICATSLTIVLQRFQPFLQQRKIDVVVSVPATLSVVILLLFSSVTTVIFKLVSCTQVADDRSDDVVFIDGTVKCNNDKRKGLFVVVSLLCLFPLVLAAALRWKRLPNHVGTAVCSAYKESRFYWGAVSLVFRLGMSIMFSVIQASPSTTAMVQLFLCVAMLILLMYQKPYHTDSTYHLDVLCHASLIIQFALEVLVRDSDSLGVSPSPNSPFSKTVQIAVEASFAMRYVPFVVGAALWVYLHRATIAYNTSSIFRSTKSVVVGCFRRLKSWVTAVGGCVLAAIQSCWRRLKCRGERKPSSADSTVVRASDHALL